MGTVEYTRCDKSLIVALLALAIATSAMGAIITHILTAID